MLIQPIQSQIELSLEFVPTIFLRNANFVLRKSVKNYDYLSVIGTLTLKVFLISVRVLVSARLLLVFA